MTTDIIATGGQTAEMPKHRFDPTTLREYDIRGIVGETLGERLSLIHI